MYHNMLQQEIIFEELCRADSAAELGLEGAGDGHVLGLEVGHQPAVLHKPLPAQVAPEQRHILIRR